MPLLILLRHGESQWNRDNRFTGNVDVPLSERGEEQSRHAADLLTAVPIERVYTSTLRRAIDTVAIILKIRARNEIPVERSSSLNERHYGDLQGLNKAEVAKQYGDQQVLLWRRSYDVRPPHGESLKDTAARTIPYFEKNILSDVRNGHNVLVVAHGNSLRSIVMFLEKLTPEQVVELDIPTGVPLMYKIGSDGEVSRVGYLPTDDEKTKTGLLEKEQKEMNC